MTKGGLEHYEFAGDRIVRELTVAGRSWRSSIHNVADRSLEPHSAWWQSFLRGASVAAPGNETERARVRVVDAFCGCGGLTLGASQAALAVGRRVESVAAIDVDQGGLEIHEANFGTQHLLHGSASSLVDFHVSGAGESSRFAYTPEIIDSTLGPTSGSIDLFLAGPPCQGHSNLNNRTRREDPRNLLYLTAIALAVGLQAKAIVIENVPDVVNDKSDVVASAKALIHSAGYGFVDSGVLAAHDLGAAQTRKRFFLIAAMREPGAGDLTLKGVAAALKHKANSVRWAIGDLLNRGAEREHAGIMDSVPALSGENRSRIEYLFRHDAYDLPDDERPDCHKNGHSYPSVYGRMYWDKPAQTITTGFLTPGRGRYIHPHEPRVITPREAARIQAFPDGFRFVVGESEPARNALTKWIGDAVPSPLGYAATLPLLTAM